MASNGLVSAAGYAHHCRKQGAHRVILDYDCLDRVGVAHWLHCAKQIQLGSKGEFYPAITKDLVKLHMERCSVYG